mgnify:CR=1 FL=1
MDRRRFIINTSLGSSAFMFFPSLLRGVSLYSGSFSKRNGTIWGLTPISVIDNACLIAFRSGKLSRASQQSVTTDIHLRDTPGNKGRLAVVLPPLDKKLSELLRKVKEGHKIKHPAEKRAIAFGWIAVNAVEKQINEAMKDLSPEEFRSARMHQDALLIQSFSEAEDSKGGRPDPRQVENLLNTMQVRTITRSHTLKPDSDDGIGWVNRISRWRRENNALMKEYAEAIVNPDASRAGEDFLSNEDPLVIMANALQRGDHVTDREIKELGDQPAVSMYGKALFFAVEHILLTDRYFRDVVSLSELEPVLLA